MADFTDLDKAELEKLRKALDRAAHTTTVKQPWGEHFARNTSAKSGQSILAAEIIKGFSGSWAASYNYGNGAGITVGVDNVRKSDSEEAPIPIRAKTTKLGRRGVPDIDFVPYNWRTNRFGSKGPALVGHPISYEVVGPTLKSPACDWTWSVDPGAGPNGGDTLRMHTRPDGGAATASVLADGYGAELSTPFTIGGATEPNGGLYVLITDDGINPVSVPAGDTPMGALPDFVDTARYEIFRVASVDAGLTVIELHPDKPLANYFDLQAPLPRTIRAITILRPYVTRLVAIPGSGVGVGRERVFAVVSPERAASSDLYPPFDGGVPGDGSWLQGGFDRNPGSTASGAIGASAQYLGRQLLPIPIPLRKSLGQVHTDTTAVPPAPGANIGDWFIQDHPSSPISGSPADIGNVMRIYNIDSQDATPLTFGSPAACLGWFPITGYQPGLTTGLIVSRAVEIDPTSGHTYFGPGPYLQNGGGPFHDLVYSVHEPVTRLWDTDFFNIDKVEACRLKNLIDPRDASRFEKQVSVSGGAGVSQPGGSSFSGPERTIFDTSTSAGGAIPGASNPGSLLDLGFRMVLFPARDDGAGNPIPDFNRPIDTRGELIIDPFDPAVQNDSQFIEVDYDGGIVRLSIPPPDRLGGDIIPNGIFGGPGTTNPRNEVVLFAACVPYSMEESQIGAGPRVVGNFNDEDVDAYSGRVTAGIDNLSTTSVGVAPFIGPSTIAPNPVEIVLDRLWEGPSSGVIEILEANATGASFGLWGYSETRDILVGVNLVTALGGISSLPTISDPGVGGADPKAVVLRREVFFAEKSFSKDFGVDNSSNDTAYGSSQRATALRFKDAAVTTNLDGSLTVTRTPPGPPGSLGWEFHQWGHIAAAQGDASGVANRNDFSTFGFFHPAAYDSSVEGGLGGPATTRGSYGTDIDGPYIMFSEATMGNYRGVLAAANLIPGITDISMVTIEQRLRLVVKFKYSNEEDAVMFLGLTGSLVPAVTLVNVDNTTNSVLPADMRVIGISRRAGGTEFEFLTSGSAGSNLVTAIPIDGNLHYFVLETSPDLGNPVNMALYDRDFNLEANTVVTDPTFYPALSQSLTFAGGVRKLGVGAGRPEVFIYYATSVIRHDLAKG